MSSAGHTDVRGLYWLENQSRFTLCHFRCVVEMNRQNSLAVDLNMWVSSLVDLVG